MQEKQVSTISYDFYLLDITICTFLVLDVAVSFA